MGLPYKTTKLIDQIADTLDDWPNENKKWNNKIIKAKPENLLSEISEGLDYIQEELRQYMPNIVQLVQERRKKLVRRVGRVYFREMESYESPRKFIISRNDATALAKTLRHVGKLAREELAAEKPAETEQDTTPAKLRRIRAWFKKHPHSYGLQGGSIFLILSLVVGLFKPQWRQSCWGVAGLAFLVLILSLLGGRSRR